MKQQEMETRIEILENQLSEQQAEIWELQKDSHRRRERNEEALTVFLSFIILLVFGFAIYGFATIMNLM